MTKTEKFVTEKYPDAVVEKYQTKGFYAKTYYLVWDGHRAGNRKRLGEGNTKAEAWSDAKESIIEFGG